MKHFVDIHFLEDFLVIEKHYDARNQPLRDSIPVSLQNIKEQNNSGLYEPSYSSGFLDFPDLSQPLPNVSIREQLRLTSVNRRKVLDWQRNHQKRLEEIWHSQSSGDPNRDLSLVETKCVSPENIFFQ
ncbi:uncharacterized protein LOC123037804 [Drosophila rhopaloa]|uniref:Uncharacterized protein n=1 Tax=Drosophila rhopaloa TaxID=1041015 RepID=A0ABM5JBN3_DRORH|nr:uncharacterized protein LOC123037804 [Drosophila rhopaloa]